MNEFKALVEEQRIAEAFVSRGMEHGLNCVVV